MAPPLVCPAPRPRERDCPLYAARIAVVGSGAALRRAILTSRPPRPALTNLIRAERRASARIPAALPPGPPPEPQSILDQLKEEVR